MQIEHSNQPGTKKSRTTEFNSQSTAGADNHQSGQSWRKEKEVLKGIKRCNSDVVKWELRTGD